MHVMDDIEGFDVELGKPGAHELKLIHDIVVIEVFACDGLCLWPCLFAALLIASAVDGVQQCLCQVYPGPEELHLLADGHG